MFCKYFTVFLSQFCNFFVGNLLPQNPIYNFHKLQFLSHTHNQSGIPFAEVLCKNRYVGRTFIQPSNRLRQLGVAKKFGALSGNVEGKRIILIDDSIVRGNTIGPIIKLLRDAGAKEVHIRIASPPLQHPCYMGINIPTRDELIANKLNPSQLAKHVGK